MHLPMEPGSNVKSKILVDAMGGDFAPRNCILGTIQALSELPDVELALIGRAEEVKNSLAELQVDFPDNRILHAEEVISMHDDPLEAIKKKKDSSIVRGVQLVKDGQFDAFVSAGHTGAMMTAGTFILGRIKGVSRATMGTPMPNSSGVSTLFDVGATVETSARFLVEYATMGSIYVREIYHIENPTVGLLSVGEEDSKGTEVTIAAHKALRESGLNFIGNLEGRDVLRGSAHVIVCDGFVGNIIIKFAESILPFLRHQFKAYAAKSIIHKLRIALLRGTFKEVMRNVDYQQYGGVPLLGVNGVMIIGHGSSSPLAIKNMIKRAADMHRVNIVEKIASAVQQIKFIS